MKNIYPMEKRLRSLPFFFLFFIALSFPAFAQEQVHYFFVKGEGIESNLTYDIGSSPFRQEEGYLSMTSAGNGKMSFSFYLSDAPPGFYYILLDLKTLSSIEDFLVIRVNGSKLAEYTFYFPDNFTTQGFEISKLLAAGENTVELDFTNVESQEIYLRGVFFGDTILFDYFLKNISVKIPPYILWGAVGIAGFILILFVFLHLNSSLRTTMRTKPLVAVTFAVPGSLLLVLFAYLSKYVLNIPDFLLLSFIIAGIVLLIAISSIWLEFSTRHSRHTA